MAAEKTSNEKVYCPVVESVEPQCRLYTRRWVILAIFMIYAIAAGMQWMQYSIITNIIMKYYNIDAYVVEWTTMLHMLAYVLCIFPALWLLDKAGNRVTMITAGAGICIGAWIKLYGVSPDRFTFVLIGQAIEASAQVLTFGLAGSVTAAWFGPNEISLAGSLALFGDQFGASLGFVLPPLVVEKSDDLAVIGQGVYKLCVIICIFTTAILVCMLIFFTDKPKQPPSNAQVVQKESRKERSRVAMFIKLISSRSFLMMLLTYGLHIGVFCSHATLLNQILLHYFPNHEKDAGMIGSLIVCCGLGGAIVGGIFLDVTHLFKPTTLSLYVCSTVCMAIYSYCLESKNLVAVYIIACVLGFCMLGYYAVALQMSIEIAYPASEGTAAGLMLFAVQIVGLVLTPTYRHIFEVYGAFESNMVLVALLTIGIIITIIIPPHTRRHDAERVRSDNEASKAFIINAHV